MAINVAASEREQSERREATTVSSRWPASDSSTIMVKAPFTDKLLRQGKLGASPQLECWNTGILEKCVLGDWRVGLMA